MKNEFSDRLAMFKTSGDMLFDPKWRAVWEGKPPLIFSTKAVAAVEATADLEEFCRRQGVVTLAGADKDREETDLEDAAFVLARALVDFYRDRGEGTEVSKFDFSISWWRRLRDTDLLGQAETVRGAVAALASGPAEVATAAAAYGLTVEAAAKLKKDWADYDALITKPRQLAGDRKVLTTQLRNRFNAVEAKFESLDDLAGQFDGTAEGRDFVAAYGAAREKITRGGSAVASEKPAPVGPPPTPA